MDQHKFVLRELARMSAGSSVDIATLITDCNRSRSRRAADHCISGSGITVSLYFAAKLLRIVLLPAPGGPSRYTIPGAIFVVVPIKQWVHLSMAACMDLPITVFVNAHTLEDTITAFALLRRKLDTTDAEYRFTAAHGGVGHCVGY